jgi:hypothetical protein
MTRYAQPARIRRDRQPGTPGGRQFIERNMFNHHVFHRLILSWLAGLPIILLTIISEASGNRDS